MDKAHIGMLLGINGLLIAAIEMVLVYKIENRRHPLLFIVRGVALAAVAYLSFNLLPAAAYVSILFILLFTASEMLSIPFMNAFFINRSADHNRGEYAALYNVAFATSTILSPLPGALMIERYGFSAWWYMAAGICLLTGAGFYYLFKRINNVRNLAHSPL